MHPMNSAPAMRWTAIPARLASSRLARAGFLSALLCLGCGLPGSIAVTLAQEDVAIYDDALENGWQSYGRATLDSGDQLTRSLYRAARVPWGQWLCKLLLHMQQKFVWAIPSALRHATQDRRIPGPTVGNPGHAQKASGFSAALI